MKVRYASGALSDLVEILTYLSGESPASADAVLKRIDKAISILSSFPYIGQEIDEAGVRMLSLARYPYLVFCRMKPGEVEILYIRHGARQRPDFD